jgi:type I restriction enzyme S subunit
MKLEWKTTVLEDVSERVTVGIATSVSEHYRMSGVPIFRNQNILPGKLDDSDLLFISEEFAKQNEAKAIKARDVLTVRTGNVGISALVPEKYASAQTFTTLITTTKHDVLLPEYFCQHLNSRFGEIQFRKLTGDSGRGNLNAGEFIYYTLELPTIGEQKKIAAILALWDVGFAILESLIAANADRKRALMQQLLMGLTRFKDFVKSDKKIVTHFGPFPADWPVVYFGDIADEIGEKNGGGNDLPVLSCTKHRGLVNSLEYFGKRIFSEDTSTYKVVRRGDFAYATNHIEEGSIGYQNMHDAALISPMYTVFRTRAGVDHSFLFKLVKTELYRHIFEANTNGSINRRGALRWDDFTRLKVHLPSETEQRRIAAVLDTCDRGIELLQKQLDALKEQKRGLMLKLLTGEVRVKVKG